MFTPNEGPGGPCHTPVKEVHRNDDRIVSKVMVALKKVPIFQLVKADLLILAHTVSSAGRKL
jgi:hypothetical protein